MNVFHKIRQAMTSLAFVHYEKDQAIEIPVQ